MKIKTKTSAIVHCSLLIAALSAPAAVPLTWQVDVTRVAPVTFDAYHGETLALEAVLKDASRPLDLTGKTASLYWQTNGMNTVYWATNAVVEKIVGVNSSSSRVDNNLLSPTPTLNSNSLASTNWCVRSTFTGAMDPGAASVRGFLGIAGENYRAAFVIRFRPSPGYAPGVLDYPPKILDLAHTVVTNPPWPTQADYAATTTAMRVEFKTYIDGQIEGAGLVTPQVVTNVVESKIAAIPRDGVSTGAVNFVIGEAVRTNWLCTVAAAVAMTNGCLPAVKRDSPYTCWDVADMVNLGTVVLAGNSYIAKGVKIYAGSPTSYTMTPLLERDFGVWKFGGRAESAGTAEKLHGTMSSTKIEDQVVEENGTYTSKLFVDNVTKRSKLEPDGTAFATLSAVSNTCYTKAEADAMTNAVLGSAVAASAAMTNAVMQQANAKYAPTTVGGIGVVRGNRIPGSGTWSITAEYAQNAYTAGTVYEVEWSKVTDTPDTLANYGITNAYTKAEADGRYMQTTDTASFANGAKMLTPEKYPIGSYGKIAFADNDGKTDVPYIRYRNGVTMESVDSYLMPDGSQFATSNMVNGIVPQFIDHTLPHFSNEVLAVGLNIDTNAVAVLNEIAATFGGFPVEGTATTVGGLLAAIAAAIAFIKKKKIDKLTCTGVSDITTDNGTADVSALFTSANTSLVSSTRYALAASDANSGSTIADRTINRVTMTASVQTFVMPNHDANKARDFIVRVEVGDLETIGGIAFSGVTAWEGDALTFEKNKNYLVAITETKYANNAPTWLVKVLALDPQTQG